LLELVGGTGSLGWVAVKAVLMFAVAVIGLRLGERRTSLSSARSTSRSRSPSARSSAGP
jgi:hypothetical protein